MSNTRLEVFIQNLKDTTTVLQQLEVCIKAIKDIANTYIHNIVITEQISQNVYCYWKFTIPSNDINELTDIANIKQLLYDTFGTSVPTSPSFMSIEGKLYPIIDLKRVSDNNIFEGHYMIGDNRYTKALGTGGTITSIIDDVKII